ARHSDGWPTAWDPLTIAHLLAPSSCTRWQFPRGEPFQVEQKPSAESFQVPSVMPPPVVALPDLPPGLPSDSRVMVPSGLNTMRNLTFEGVDAVNGLPLKNVVSTSLGARRPTGAATTRPALRRSAIEAPAIRTRIDVLL